MELPAFAFGGADAEGGALLRAAAPGADEGGAAWLPLLVLLLPLLLLVLVELPPAALLGGFAAEGGAACDDGLDGGFLAFGVLVDVLLLLPPAFVDVFSLPPESVAPLALQMAQPLH